MRKLLDVSERKCSLFSLPTLAPSGGKADPYLRIWKIEAGSGPRRQLNDDKHFDYMGADVGTYSCKPVLEFLATLRTFTSQHSTCLISLQRPQFTSIL